MTQQREPFDPADPMDAMSENFRLQITKMALDAYKIAIYRDLNPQDQLRSFIAGALTGVIGVSLASIDSKGADALMDYLAECLPIARQMAEAVRGPDGKPLLNHHDGDASSLLATQRGGAT